MILFLCIALGIATLTLNVIIGLGLFVNKTRMALPYIIVTLNTLYVGLAITLLWELV